MCEQEDDPDAGRRRGRTAARGEPADEGKSFKAVVNTTLRAGLDRRSASDLPPFKVKARPMGLKPGFDPDHIEELLDRLEEPHRR